MEDRNVPLETLPRESWVWLWLQPWWDGILELRSHRVCQNPCNSHWVYTARLTLQPHTHLLCVEGPVSEPFTSPFFICKTEKIRLTCRMVGGMEFNDVCQAQQGGSQATVVLRKEWQLQATSPLLLLIAQ